MKKYLVLISIHILLATVSLNCAQSRKKEPELLLAAIPQPLWHYDTGG